MSGNRWVQEDHGSHETYHHSGAGSYGRASLSHRDGVTLLYIDGVLRLRLRGGSIEHRRLAGRAVAKAMLLGTAVAVETWS